MYENKYSNTVVRYIKIKTRTTKKFFEAFTETSADRDGIQKRSLSVKIQ